MSIEEVRKEATTHECCSMRSGRVMDSTGGRIAPTIGQCNCWCHESRAFLCHRIDTVEQERDTALAALRLLSDYCKAMGEQNLALARKHIKLGTFENVANALGESYGPTRALLGRKKEVGL
ncbi:hypothetical protein LCGC14_1177470 [marine sediment metagenome]|uniref:Uncharacterized protein n=1 Tax=marine sediment metagenome TaxID=412755 RepID=A0A0F9PTJ3_9ZZZZ